MNVLTIDPRHDVTIPGKAPEASQICRNDEIWLTFPAAKEHTDLGIRDAESCFIVNEATMEGITCTSAGGQKVVIRWDDKVIHRIEPNGEGELLVRPTSPDVLLH